MPTPPTCHRWPSQLGAIGAASVAFVLTVLLSGGTSPLLALAGAVAIGAGVIVVLVLAEHDIGTEWILRGRPRRARSGADRPEEELPAGR